MKKVFVLYAKDMRKSVDRMYDEGHYLTPQEILSDYAVVFESECKDDVLPDELFVLLNSDENPLACIQGQKKIKKLGVDHTSMCIGDILVIDKEWHVCDVSGWKEISSIKDLQIVHQ
jgi:hypothetical protein